MYVNLFLSIRVVPNLVPTYQILQILPICYQYEESIESELSIFTYRS